MKKVLFLLMLCVSASLSSQVLSERERAKVYDEILAERFNKLLPELMDRVGIDMWLVISREYNHI